MTTRREFTKSTLAATVGAVAASSPLRALSGRTLDLSRPLVADTTRLNGWLTQLAEFGKNPQGGVSRVAYSEFDKQGRAMVMGLMREAGLAVEIDLAGNIIGRRAGTLPSARAIAFGSHIDSVPEGGNYDGTVGSLAAIEAVRTMQERGIRTRHPLELIVFQNEEGGTVGSRALVGELKGPDLDLGTKSGKTIRSGISFIGGNPDRLDEVTRKPGDLAAYVELHIEQGGSLHADGIDIGVVEGIVGIGWWDVTIDGFANHAGTTAMNNRRDAMLAFARFTDMVNRVITSEPGRQVGTVGKVFAFPGAPNVVPGKVMCSLEIRELDNARIASFFDRIKQEAEKIGTATGTTFAFQSTHDSQSALTDPRIQQVITNVAAELKLTSRPMPSGAGHDAQHMAHLCPSGMIFIPSIDGISHAPKEFSRPADVGNGANVLLRTLLSLDEQFAG